MESFVSTPDQFAVVIKADLAKFIRIIKTANIKLENGLAGSANLLRNSCTG
jgi:hypothetical protein